MAQELKAGSRWRSAVCSTEVIVVRPPRRAVTLQCGGAEMVEGPAAGASEVAGVVDPAHAGGTALGKRYEHAESGMEVLCVKAGEGALAVDGVALPFKEAKPLPSSD
ncbi:MAG TPA: hypothetical protein VKU91_04965 [Acidimicrobiales bacterium]|nr:hypothetical protein [Acidimicrobiales bacterium]